jgi:DNA-binding NtrC family response regulator
LSPVLCSGHQEYPLLEKLNSSGTLFIKNVHFLDIDAQQLLAEFLRYGMFRMFKSDQKIPSDVRIICSSAQNLQHLVQEGSFCPALHERLKQMHVSLPPLITLAEPELYSLADGFAEQAIKTHDFKMFLELTDKDKNRIALKRPASLYELKVKVQQALVQKSKRNQVYDDLDFDPAYEVSDPELIKAARLGKYALKDQTIMGILWHKFKNQNKIATFLGVNRSSVNRRCKEYNLLEQ